MTEKSKTEQVVTGVAKGSIGAVMPYVAVGTVGYLLYKAVKGRIDDSPRIPFLGGLFGPDGSLGGSGLPSVDAEVVKKAGSTAKSSFLDGLLDGLSTSLGLGLPPSAFSNKQDDKDIVNQWTDEQLTGLSFMNMLKESGNQVVRDDLVKKFGTMPGTMPTLFNVTPTINPDKEAYTQQSLANKVAASGMPSSNLNKGTVKGTEIDKDGKERIIIKYDNGVTMRY